MRIQKAVGPTACCFQLFTCVTLAIRYMTVFFRTLSQSQVNRSVNREALSTTATSKLNCYNNDAARDCLWTTDQMMRLKSHVLRCWWNDVNDWANNVVSFGRAFQMRGAATGKARLPTVESLAEGTTRRLVPAERSVCRPCIDRRPESVDPGSAACSRATRKPYIQSAVRQPKKADESVSGRVECSS